MHVPETILWQKNSLFYWANQTFSAKTVDLLLIRTLCLCNPPSHGVVFRHTLWFHEFSLCHACTAWTARARSPRELCRLKLELGEVWAPIWAVKKKQSCKGVVIFFKACEDWVEGSGDGIFGLSRRTGEGFGAGRDITFDVVKKPAPQSSFRKGGACRPQRGGLSDPVAYFDQTQTVSWCPAPDLHLRCGTFWLFLSNTTVLIRRPQASSHSR